MVTQSTSSDMTMADDAPDPMPTEDALGALDDYFRDEILIEQSCLVRGGSSRSLGQPRLGIDGERMVHCSVEQLARFISYRLWALSDRGKKAWFEEVVGAAIDKDNARVDDKELERIADFMDRQPVV